jgi:uncharacterized protein (TIGR02246 family)
VRDDVGVTPEEEEVSEANRAFYAAFEARDVAAMAEVWDPGDEATVVHPGWPVLRGWQPVAESWQRIFDHTPYIQFFLTEEQVTVVGTVAWVTLYENILQEVAAPGRHALGDSRVAATNVFVRREGRWRLVLHHGSPVG